MKSIRVSRIILALFFFSHPVFSQCLSGTYTIAPSGGNYASFSLAVTDLISYGVCGPVTFLVSDSANYSEQISIPFIAGSSDTNRIVFKSNPTNLSQPVIILSPPNSNPYLVLLDSACYISFDGIWLDYGGGTGNFPYQGGTILLRNGCSHNTFTNCTLSSGNFVCVSEWYPAPTSINDNEISNCNVLLGNISLRGDTATAPCINTRILHNFFGESADVLLTGMGSVEISDNTFQNVIPSNTNPAITLLTCNGKSLITRNKLIGEWTNGINVSNGFSAEPITISNNMISCGGTSTSTNIEGLFIFSVNYAAIYNNSIGIYSSHLSGYDAALYMQNSINVDLKNNIFSNFAGNRVLYITNATSSFHSDYNDFKTTGTTLISFNGNQFPDISSWQANTGARDQHSFSVDPLFTDTNNLHSAQPQIRNKALALTAIVNDIDLEPRNIRPDIGADEFSSVTDSVWPGDTNNDGISDASDLLPIGMYFMEQGPGRVPFSNSWVGYHSYLWNIQVPNFNDAKFADCNGDGIVNLDDTLALSINGGLSHALRIFPTSTSAHKNIYLHFLNDTVTSGTTVQAILGFDAFANGIADSIYSLQISIVYSPSTIVASTFNVYKNIALWGSYATDYLTLLTENINSNQVVISSTGIDHQQKPVDRNLISFSCKVVNYTGQGYWYKLPVQSYSVYDKDGSPLSYHLISDSVFITSITGMPAIDNYPLPAFSRSENVLTFLNSYDQFSIIDLCGRIIFEKQHINSNDQVIIPDGADGWVLTAAIRNGKTTRVSYFYRVNSKKSVLFPKYLSTYAFYNNPMNNFNFCFRPIFTALNR